MRKPRISLLLVLTIVFGAFTGGFFLGRNQRGNDLSVSVPEQYVSAPEKPQPTVPKPAEETQVIFFPISLNQAEKAEFMALPGIGEVLAERILAYRQENGPFSAPEELLNVEGIGKKRLEQILDLITIGGYE